MKLKERFRWTRRAKKLSRSGNPIQKEGISIGSELFKLLKLNPIEILLIGNFAHPILAETRIMEIQIESLPQHLLRRVLSLIKKLAKLGVKNIEALRRLHSIDVTFMWKDWEFIFNYTSKPSNATKHAWVREFLLNEMGPDHIAKVKAFIGAGIKSDSAFKEILKNWVPNNMAIQRLVDFQVEEIKGKPLVKLVIGNGKIEEFIYENDSWVKKELI